MNTILVPAQGRWCDTSITGNPPTWYRALRAAGYQGITLDLASQGWQTDYTYALEAGLAVMLNQGYVANQWADPTQAKTTADYAIQQVESVQYNPGATLFLDCEAMDGITADQALAWLNTWDMNLHATGYTRLGKYEGPNCPLSGAQWYGLPLTVSYYKAKSLVPPIPHRGYQLIQTGVQRLFRGVYIDEDEAGPDKLGQHAMAVLKAPSVPPTPPKPSGVVAGPNWEPMMATLQQTVTALPQQVADLHAALLRPTK